MNNLQSLRDRLANLSEDKRRLLSILASVNLDTKERPVRHGLSAYPLSYAQQRLWFMDQLEPGSGAYNIGAAVRLRGELSKERLGEAIGEVVSRHEVLGTRFEE